MPRKRKDEKSIFGLGREKPPARVLAEELSELLLGGSSSRFTLRDEANAIVAYAFRNGPIETLHTGKHSELLTDKSLSKITNEGMKRIMIAACRKVEGLLRRKETDPAEYYRWIRQYNLDQCRGWER
jgi:hypothetical protein